MATATNKNFGTLNYSCTFYVINSSIYTTVILLFIPPYNHITLKCLFVSHANQCKQTALTSNKNRLMAFSARAFSAKKHYVIAKIPTQTNKQLTAETKHSEKLNNRTFTFIHRNLAIIENKSSRFWSEVETLRDIYEVL